jgi:hypothetical protein
MTRLESLVAAAALAGSATAPAAAQYGQYQQPYPQQPYQQPYEQQQQPYQQYPQSYPQQPYQQQVPSYPYSGQNYGNEQSEIGAIVDSMIGNRYAVSDRQAIHSCAWAAVQRARSYGISGYGGGYNGYGYGYGRHLRVTSINDVQRRTMVLRVRGTLGRGGSYGGYGGPGYANPGYNGPGYGNPGYGASGYARPEFSFTCDVGYNGYVQNVRVESLYRHY